MLALRPYQEAAVAEISRAINLLKHRRVLLVLPTGGGKTTIFSYMAAKSAAAGKRVWIIAHRAELLDQISRTLMGFEVAHGMVCAGRYGTHDLVQVCSVQTVVRRMDRMVAAYGPPDLIISDEAHHAVAGQWLKVLQRFENTPTVGVTATPIRLDGRGLGDVFSHMVLGPSAAWLTENGFLAPAVIYAPQLADASTLGIRGGDYRKEAAAELMDKPTICGEAVGFYQRYALGKRILVFCVNLTHVTHTVAAYKSAGIAAEALDGSLTDSVRRERVAAFTASRLKVLVTCELVNEGFDVPGCDGVQLLRPTQSLGLYLQQVGRGLRPAPGKYNAIILDHVGNVGRMVNGVFQPKHGLPTQEREWSLDAAKKRAKSDAGNFAIRQCLRCYNVYEAFKRACPECGWNPPVEDRTPEVIAGELAMVAEAAAQVPQAPVTPEEREALMKSARTLRDWHAVAKRLGYKAAWAWRQFNQAGN